MEIIVVNKKSEFTPEQVEQLSILGNLIFIETADEFQDKSKLMSSEDKIIALDPGISNWSCPNELIDQIPNLKAVCLPTTKHGWVDGAYLKQKGILLTNVPKYSTESVAEHCILLMLMLAKRLPLVINEGWKLNYDKHLGNEVKGAEMGIIGLGDIGKRVAELGQSMSMNVSYWSRNTTDSKYTHKELNDLIKTSQYIFLTISEAPETKNFFNNVKADLMSKDSFLINISGDEVWDFDYLANKVKSGGISGIALDDDRRQMQDFGANILITPHIAWYTKEAFKEDFRIWVECIKSAVEGNPINVAN